MHIVQLGSASEFLGDIFNMIFFLLAGSGGVAGASII